nr:MAG TPA: hypothetical protein [Caudoviricetes sp.]
MLPGKSVARTIRCTFLSLQPWLPIFFPLLWRVFLFIICQKKHQSKEGDGFICRNSFPLQRRQAQSNKKRNRRMLCAEKLGHSDAWH